MESVHGEDVKERNPLKGPSGPRLGHKSHDSFSEFEGFVLRRQPQHLLQFHHVGVSLLYHLA